MLNSHTSAGIAQVVFYLPVLPIAIFNLVRIWNHGLRMVCFPLVTFSIFRFAGGVVTIIQESNPKNVGLIIATTVLLNVGLIPLLIATVGFIRLILTSSTAKNQRANLLLKIIRSAVIIAISLLIISGGLSGSEKFATVSRSLSITGYVMLAVVVILMTIELFHLFTERHHIAADRFIYIRLTLACMPALLLRTIYGLLCAFTEDQPSTIWSPLYGSAVAFALMCLLMEYVTFLIFIFLGIRYWRDLRGEILKSPPITAYSV